MISISRQGVTFDYSNDKITRLWPWVSGLRFKSSLYAIDFNSFQEYWRRLGALEHATSAFGSSRNVVGLRLHEVLSEYVGRNYPGEYIAVLTDIDVSKKDSTFWSRIPKQSADQLLKDLAIFRCKDRAQMLGITAATSQGFATAYAFENGKLVDSNLWGSE